jgi:hypothetical protein
MNARIDLCPPELEDRLIEWSRHFKDRALFTRCASLEGRFNPHAPDAWDSGWGDPGAPIAVLPDVDVLRAAETNAAIVGLGNDSTAKVYKWAITYHYCFPGLDRWRVLKAIKRRSGRRLNWKQYGEHLDIARVRVWTLLLNTRLAA